ncbi:MAG TPA: transglutaminaseTgpA domain-containing protein [Jatrophihabitans sp.]|nr:transglutaminaseTgpA domain-containing protein [Jatrophihabitans sp.]
MNRVIRRLAPLLLLPLAVVACGLASAPWLRAFPSTVLAVPLFGAALLSVLLPVVVVGIGVRRLWLTALLDLLALVFYVMLVALREPLGFADLWTGLLHGPSQILTFALPLVSPRTLLVAPVALCWLTGALIGECLARGWQSVVPYLASLVAFGLAYAGTERAAVTADARRYEILLAGGLLLALLLLRAVHTWVDQDQAAESTQPEGVLPLRGLAVGAALSVVVAVAAGATVQSSAFPGRAAVPARTPPVDTSAPLAPLSFVSGLRPKDPKSPGRDVFQVTFGAEASRYIEIGDVDSYNGDSWSFTRTFRPSGGEIPADSDPAMVPSGSLVAQQYTIDKGPLTQAPWMPFLYRPQRVHGVGVNIDPVSGMIVPAHRLRKGTQYSVQSRQSLQTLDELRPTVLPGTSYESTDVQLPFSVTTSLGPVLASLQKETHTSDSSPIAFLQALAADLRNNYALSGAPASGAPSGSASGPASGAPSSKPVPSSAAGPDYGMRTAGTGFAAVLASILGTARTATPEQYATLVALVARQLHVPARVATGFRLPSSGGSSTVEAGTYQVTTAEAWSWVEIPIQGHGWVVLDPSPGKGSSARPAPSSSGARPTTRTSSSPPQNALITHSNRGGHAVAPKGHVHAQRSTPVLSIVAITGAILLALAIAVLLGMLARKHLRLRRRRAGDPRGRLVGAWLESIDMLMESGLPDLTCLTSTEIAAATGTAFGDEPAASVRLLGSSADTAVYAPSRDVVAADADAAWSAHRVLRRAVRRQLGPRQRLRARLRYHRSAGRRLQPRRRRTH